MNLNPAPERLGAPDAYDLLSARDAVRPGFGEYLGAQVREGFWATTTGQGIAQAQKRIGGEGEAPLTAEEWRQSEWFRPSVPFDEAMTPTRARAVAETFDANEYRRWLISQRKAGIVEGTAGFAAGVVGSIPDPVNFIPFFGPAYRAATVARFGVIGGRAALGAAEAALGTAIAQPFLMTSRQQFGDDVTLADAMLDIALSAFAGAAIGGASGVWTRATTRTVTPKGGEPEIRVEPRAPEQTARDPIPDAQTQEAAVRALSSAMRDLAEGRPIDVDPRLAGEFDATAINRASTRMSDLMSSTALGRTMDTAPDIRLGAEPDPRAIFREIAPDIAARVDEIQTRMDTQRRWLDELRVSAETQVRADFDPRIEALQTRAETASAKNRARLTKEIDALTAERDAALERARTTDTPDAARVRQAVLADELKLRELAPEMSAAMREAERKARARTPRIESRIALADAIARRQVDFSPGVDIDAVLRQADPVAATPARATQAAQAPADATPARTANPERKALESDTDALLAELEADPRHAETAKAARADLARAAAFDEAAPAAASCLKG